MIREQTLLIGIKDEIREHLKTKYRVQESIPEVKSKGVRYFNTSFDVQVSDTFMGYIIVGYLEVIDVVDSQFPELGPSMSMELKLAHCLVRDKTTEQYREEQQQKENKK